MDNVHWFILCAAIVLDMLVGDPDGIWRRFPHPVVWFGWLITLFDRHLNRRHFTSGVRRIYGVFACFLLLMIAALSGGVLSFVFDKIGLLGVAAEVLVVSVLIAQRSLSDHVTRVLKPLSDGDLGDARRAISMIVGRDPSQLDEAGISRASIESLAENFSDGVVAPVFWYALFGLPGMFVYKMLNTADSMVGHMSEKYQDFGWASAKFDDVANWLPARLSAILIAGAASLRNGINVGWKSITTAFREAHFHRSPNAGWPEAAMAGALDIVLAGPRKYIDHQVDDRFINETGRYDVKAADVQDANGLFWYACIIEFFITLLLFVLGLQL